MKRPRMGFWAVEVRMGLKDRRTFVSADRSDESIQGTKQGKKAASIVALEGLKDEIRREMEKPVVSGLEQAVGHLFEGTEIVESSEKVWQQFWKNVPDVVGVDTEGNMKSPPVLVQIATDGMVVLEAPRAGGLSENLKRLLSDDTIVKVFCDNGSQRDKKSLGLAVPYDLGTGPIVDVEIIAANLMGPVTVCRGVSKMLALTMPELGCRIEKGSRSKRFKEVFKFTAIEQGFRPPLRGAPDLTEKEQRYAALDAWCTLQIWRRLMIDLGK